MSGATVTLTGEPRGIVFGLDNHEAFIAAGDGVYEVGLDEALAAFFAVLDRYTLADVVAQLRQTVEAHLGQGPVATQVLKESLLAPACGLALRSVTDAERIFNELKQVQRALLG